MLVLFPAKAGLGARLLGFCSTATAGHCTLYRWIQRDTGHCGCELDYLKSEAHMMSHEMARASRARAVRVENTPSVLE